jgi:hypothetical protein
MGSGKDAPVIRSCGEAVKCVVRLFQFTLAGGLRTLSTAVTFELCVLKDSAGASRGHDGPAC